MSDFKKPNTAILPPLKGKQQTTLRHMGVPDIPLRAGKQWS